MQPISAANDERYVQRPCRTLPIRETLSSIPGYPEKLRIYLTHASPYWQVRCFHHGKMRTQSTRTSDKKVAMRQARLFYEEIIAADYVARYVNKEATEHRSIVFGDLIPKVMELEAGRVMRSDLTEKAYRIARYRIDKSVMPTFGRKAVEQISFLDLEKYVADLSAQGLRGVAISQYLVIVRKILNYAFQANLIQHMPPFPKVANQRVPRGGFTIKEYHRLLQTAWHMRGRNYEMQTRAKQTRLGESRWATVHMPVDMTRLIGFMVNSFVRPTDIKLIQHKHVEILDEQSSYLRLTLPETKRHDKPIVTMPAAVGIYRRLLADAQAKGFGKPDDYLFLPQFSNREHALRHMGFLFNWLLEETGLAIGPKGQKRTIYSLRHTAITFRLLYGQGIDVLTLARNARTSVEMVERFYASTLSGEMNVALLHSKRAREA